MREDLGADAIVARVHAPEPDAVRVGLQSAMGLVDVDDHAAA